MNPPSPLRTIAVIDLGSNSARIVILKYRAGYAYHIDTEIREIVRLREGMTDAGLAPAAAERALHTLRLFSQFAAAVEADSIVAVATSAVREARDGAAFVQRVRDELGLTLRVLSGEEEAHYGALGALNAVPMQDGVVLDMGGGSIQLSRIENGRFARGQALSLGSLALTERFFRSDPPPRKELKQARSDINAQLDTVTWLAPPVTHLVGLGGTIRNLAKIEAARIGYPLQRIGGFVLMREALDALVERLSTFNVRQRQQLPGLKSDRADIILAGALVLQEIMIRYQVPALTVSPTGLREGLFFEQFWTDAPYPVPPDVRHFSVLNIARFYGYHERHAHHVEGLATRLFDELAPLHGLGAPERALLSAAATLHDLGTIISYNDHHKHSQTLIVSSGLPGYTPRETALIALLTRYHRKGAPSVGDYESVVEAGDATRLRWLSALLRLAEYLERGRDGNVYDIAAAITSERVAITVHARTYPFVELWESEKNALPLLQSLCARELSLHAAQPLNVL